MRQTWSYPPRMRTRIVTLVPAVAVLALAGCSWTQYRGDSRHSGVNPLAPGVDTTTLASLVPAWTSLPLGLTGAEVTVRDGRGFAPAGTALRAIDLVDGHELWHVDHATTHTANILNPASTFTTGSGSAVAMSEFFLDFNLQSPQFGSASGQVRYLDPATGQLLSTSPDASYATPIEANGWT